MSAQFWKRKTWVTRGADPTEVVQWEYRLNDLGIRLTEFQGIIGVEINRHPVTDPLPYWAGRFEQLESRWQEEQDRADDGDPGPRMWA